MAYKIPDAQYLIELHSYQLSTTTNENKRNKSVNRHARECDASDLTDLSGREELFGRECAKRILLTFKFTKRESEGQQRNPRIGR